MRQSQLEPRRSGNRRLIVGILVACLLLLVVGPKIEPVAGLLSPIYSPVDALVSTVASDVGSFLDSQVKAPALSSENSKLRKQVAHLQQELADLPLYRREDKALARMVHFSDLNPHLDLVGAILESRGPAGIGARITVGAGSNQGVHVNDPVLDPNGYLAGKVLTVTPATSTVGLLTDFAVDIPAMDAETAALGLVQSQGGNVMLDDIESGHKFKSGDYVVTSAVGAEYPVGLLIGQITSVQSGKVQSLNSAAVRTGADLNTINYVQVITGFGPGTKARYPKSKVP